MLRTITCGPRVAIGVMAAVIALSACGRDGVDAGAGATADLLIEATRASGTQVSWTLTCDPVAGSHPEAEQACAVLAAAEDELLMPVPADSVCTEQYGGPDTARITGTWRGRVIDVSLSRINGCYISQWEALMPVVPASDWDPATDS
jgi:hypothetical protein